LDDAFLAIEEIQNSTSVWIDQAVAASAKSIQDNGLYIGDRWFLGEQNDNLFAIDVLSPSFYEFQKGVNATLV
jgi:hypothetical protein